ncbi:hypothetical protein RFI_09844 [Reticulomyxa filosa]|uniref:Uncharacterized protein n=1 Tax=Reticulomyxa filosa TaxID=46433 RepID=X6NNK4_RETFI|nr:hypothetical protein RFI_09844 [Reticulomyxa filosa]|eukprot:ETO27289.1 hypothetical protein RFI_09844 [Reticulomyxa filosa]
MPIAKVCTVIRIINFFFFLRIHICTYINEYEINVYVRVINEENKTADTTVSQEEKNTDEKEVELIAGHLELQKLPTADIATTTPPPPLDNPFDWQHLRDFHPRLFHGFIKKTPTALLRDFCSCKYTQDIWLELNATLNSHSICGKCFSILFLLCFVLTLYFLLPSYLFLLLSSFFYPLTAFVVTFYFDGWQRIDYLQLLLTCIYAFVFLSLLLLTPHDQTKFVHEMRCRYIDLQCTDVRNKLVKNFFGELASEILQFLPEMHYIDNIDEEYIKKLTQTWHRFDDSTHHTLFDYTYK